MRAPTVPETLAARITAACRVIEAAEASPALESLARVAGLSPHHFHRVFKAITGVTPKAYAAATRHARLRDALTHANSVTDAIYEAGFNSSGRFYENALPALGMTPTAFRRRGAGETIRFAVGQCRLGAILVASSARGICAISLGNDPNTLAHALQDQFPAADLFPADPDFEGLVAQVVGLVETPAARCDLPLDIRGTAFQQRVWQALRAVPAGQTATYAEIAARIGRPTAARAVAKACASNVLAVAIPCHRIVRQDGALAGYRWGVERKSALLARETQTAA